MKIKSLELRLYLTLSEFFHTNSRNNVTHSYLSAVLPWNRVKAILRFYVLSTNSSRISLFFLAFLIVVSVWVPRIFYDEVNSLRSFCEVASKSEYMKRMLSINSFPALAQNWNKKSHPAVYICLPANLRCWKMWRGKELTWFLRWMMEKMLIL